MKEKTAFSIRRIQDGRGKYRLTNRSPTIETLSSFGYQANKLQETPLDVWKKKHEKAG